MKLKGTIGQRQSPRISRGLSSCVTALDPNPAVESTGEIEINSKIRIKSAAFTLIEILIAVAIFGIVLVAINTVFFSGLRLQRTTTALLDESAPIQQAFAMMRRDLQGATLPPTNSAFGSWFRSGTVGRSFGGSDETLEFYTTTGTLSEEHPWSDLQRVSYQLTNSTDKTTLRGRDLVRVVTRNLLPTTTEEYDPQFVMSGVESMEYECYNGTDWRTTWDIDAGDIGLPLAVRVRVTMARENNSNNTLREPLELLVPIVTQARTNATQVAGGGA